ncbi:hypothetical protein [Nonomuraea sp. NPDC049480]|uniref:hypothetical protein n=1 Tax=Nonomuraea sp. NPDC049480 TaxID=3364353 RepID=UPI0037A97B5D
MTFSWSCSPARCRACTTRPGRGRGLFALLRRERGVPVPEIARKLIIPAGKNKGSNPSLAGVYRVPAAEGEAAP